MRQALVTALLLFSSAAFGLDPVSQDLPVSDPDHPPRAAELTIVSHGQRMPALLYEANGAGPHPTVVLLHGLPGNEKNLDLAQAARRAGFNTLFFHYRGAWGAEGQYALLQLADDAAAVLAWLRQPANAERHRVDPDKLTTLGHSMGGFASLAIGARDPALACVGALAPANLAVMAGGIEAGDPAMSGFVDYADSLFMLAGFDGAKLRAELSEAETAAIDTRRFGPGLAGKSVFMITGTGDRVLPPALMFDPVTSAYGDQPGLRLEEHRIPGDHSFSATRVQLTRLVLDWLQRDCR